ncbi:MAG: RNA polymerase sigma-70 factor [Bacteroides salyersiae]|jgi:RNA polymerase sigma-70 factor (ECF subfamily)|nr:RNA polymerase sigma-70 factor [Bacteroides salyersiae]MBS4850892.1 RNA polymerase sigma-70 factor [Bacteroides salyersiae]
MTMSNKNDIITDNNVMIYLREGNEYAFRFIFDKYYDFLCMVADSYLRDEYISETIVGDIIYNLWEIKDNIDIKYSLRSYLVRSVKNRCINYLQQEYIQREISINQYEDKAAIEELFFIENKHPLESLLEQELENKINSIINELSPECRAVFKMSRFDGMKYEEIASELNLSVNTVKYHMKNALGKLRLELKDYILSILVFLTLL